MNYAISLTFSSFLLISSISAQAKFYYVSQSTGDDRASGQAQERSGTAGPWKSLAKASAVDLTAGDRIMLKCGDTWTEELSPKGNGTAGNPIVIGSYGQGPKPVIDREDFTQDRMGIHFSNQGGFKIVGIEFKRCLTGIYAEYADNGPTHKYM